jgi:hypothetical protein
MLFTRSHLLLTFLVPRYATNPYVQPMIFIHINVHISVYFLSSSKATLPSNFLPVFEKYDRERHHGYCQESQETGRPLISECVIHLDSK